MAQGSSSNGKFSAKRWTLCAVCASLTIVNTTFSLLSPIFPEVAEQKGTSEGITGLIFSSYSIATVVTAPLIGHWLHSGRLARLTCLLLGVVVVGVASALFGLVVYIPSVHSFILVCLLLRILLGLGCAAVDTSSTAIIAGLYSEDAAVGRAMGLVEACLGIGWVLGPGLGGFLAEAGGFSLPFYVAAAATLILGPVPLLLQSRGLEAAQRGAGGITPSMLHMMSLPPIVVLASTAMLGAAALTWVDPTLQLHLAKFGISTGMVGVAFAIISLVYALASPLAGYMADKYGASHVMLAGLVMAAVSYMALGPSPLLPFRGAHHLWILLSLVLMGAGGCMMFVPALPAMIHSVEQAYGPCDNVEDTLSGLLNAAYYLGGGVAPALSGFANGLMGFEWAATLFGLLLLIQCLPIAMMHHTTPRSHAAAAAPDTRSSSSKDLESLLSAALPAKGRAKEPTSPYSVSQTASPDRIPAVITSGPVVSTIRAR